MVADFPPSQRLFLFYRGMFLQVLCRKVDDNLQVQFDCNTGLVTCGYLRPVWNLKLNIAPPSQYCDSTLKLPALDIDSLSVNEFDNITSLSAARTTKLEKLLRQSRSGYAELSQSYQRLQDVHVQVIKENALLIKKQRSEAKSFSDSMSEIIALRRQVAELTEQTRQLDSDNTLWQIKYEQQQHGLDSYARCIDDLQCELRRSAAKRG